MENIIFFYNDISQFLAKSRARSSALSVPTLESFSNTTDMRLKVLWAHISSMKEKAELKGREPSLQDDEILKPITRCFTSIEVSTNRNDINKYVSLIMFCISPFLNLFEVRTEYVSKPFFKGTFFEGSSSQNHSFIASDKQKTEPLMNF